MKEKKEKRITIRLTPKLYKQIMRYAEKNDEGLPSTSARKILQKYFIEN